MVLIDIDTFNEVHHPELKHRSDVEACGVLLLVANECDAICASRVISTVLRLSNISYQVVPIAGHTSLDEVNQHFVRGSTDVHTIFMINCGAAVDVAATLSLTKRMRVYVVDASRPVHHTNVHNRNQVFVLHMNDIHEHIVPTLKEAEAATNEESCKQFDELETIMDAHGGPEEYLASIGADSDSDSDGDGEQRDGSASRRRAMHAEYMMIRAARVRFDTYYSGTAVSRPAAFLAWEIASRADLERNDLLWLAIVGVTAQFVDDRITKDMYDLCAADLGSCVLEHNPMPVDNDDNEDKSTANTTPANRDGTIRASREFRFMMLRQWSLFDSMFYSDYVAARLRSAHSLTGSERLQELLARMGIPLKLCKQPFVHLPAAQKQRVQDNLLRLKDEFSMSDILYDSFHRQLDFKVPIVAADVAHAVRSLAECYSALRHVDHTQFSTDSELIAASAMPASTDVATDTEPAWKVNFRAAYDSLSFAATRTLEVGMNAAQVIQKSIMRLAPALKLRGHLFRLARFRMVKLMELSDTDRHIFTQPMALARLGKHLLTMHRSTWIGDRAVPLVMCALDTDRKMYTVVGIPKPEPEITRGRRRPQLIGTVNSFGQAFAEAANSAEAHFAMDFLDKSCMQVGQDDLDRFLNTLNDVLNDFEEDGDEDDEDQWADDSDDDGNDQNGGLHDYGRGAGGLGLAAAAAADDAQQESSDDEGDSDDDDGDDDGGLEQARVKRQRRGLAQSVRSEAPGASSPGSEISADVNPASQDSDDSLQLAPQADSHVARTGALYRTGEGSPDDSESDAALSAGGSDLSDVEENTVAARYGDAEAAEASDASDDE